MTVYAPNIENISGQTITGYGTLIVGDDFILSAGTTLDWYGDIFVIGDSTDDAELKVTGAGSSLTVTGNVVVLGEGAIDTEFEVDHGGSATINGALFLGTDWTNPAGPEAELEIEEGGTLIVNGLLTLMGAEVEIEFKDVISNSNNQISITGQMQLAVPPASAGIETEVELELHGAIQLIKDDAMIQAGVDSLQQLDANYTIPRIADLLTNTNEFTVSSWRQIIN